MDLFKNISSKNKEKLLRLIEANTIIYKENTSILNTLKNENIIGMVLEGNIQIIKNDYSGNRTLIEDLFENDIFGTILSHLNNKEYEIVTKEKAKLIIIDFDTIINTKQNNKEFYNQFIKNLLEIIVKKINEKNERIEILANKSIRNKLLEYFRITAKKNGTKIIYLPFTFTDLADYLSVDRSAMSRELKNLKDEGFIEIKQKRITLLY